MQDPQDGVQDDIQDDNSLDHQIDEHNDSVITGDIQLQDISDLGSAEPIHAAQIDPALEEAGLSQLAASIEEDNNIQDLYNTDDDSSPSYVGADDEDSI